VLRVLRVEGGRLNYRFKYGRSRVQNPGLRVWGVEGGRLNYRF
jgi:hypothetical protein